MSEGTSRTQVIDTFGKLGVASCVSGKCVAICETGCVGSHHYVIGEKRRGLAYCLQAVWHVGFGARSEA